MHQKREYFCWNERSIIFSVCKCFVSTQHVHSRTFWHCLRASFPCWTFSLQISYFLVTHPETSTGYSSYINVLWYKHKIFSILLYMLRNCGCIFSVWFILSSAIFQKGRWIYNHNNALYIKQYGEHFVFIWKNIDVRTVTSGCFRMSDQIK